jgi:nucleotide-binding universal stress UspA family protein
MAAVIVVGVDAFHHNERALTAAARLAERTDHVLVAVYVAHIPAAAAADPLCGSIIMTSLDDTVDHCHMACELSLARTDVHWTFEVRHGDPASALMQAGIDHDADCIVVGRRGSRPLAARLLGSVTKRLVLHADRPVLVVPPSHA